MNTAPVNVDDDGEDEGDIDYNDNNDYQNMIVWMAHIFPHQLFCTTNNFYTLA